MESLESEVIRIEKVVVSVHEMQSHALFFLPAKVRSDICAVFTHGMTSHKGAILSWATRLAEAGVANALFDLPGHYLGSFNEVPSLSCFTRYAHQLFFAVEDLLIDFMRVNPGKMVFGGHSLGGLLALMALGEDAPFRGQSRYGLGVGLGIHRGEKHVFDSALFRKTMQIRNGLISPHLHTDHLLPWIKSQKENLKIKDKRIHLICGKNDIIVGDGGAQLLCDRLLEQNNQVSLDQPARLSHHQPELASSEVYRFISSLEGP